MPEQVWKRYLNRPRMSLWSLLVPVMWGISGLYFLGNRFHRLLSRPSKVAEVPVISVGNIAAGGTGKTPIVAFLAAKLSAQGVRVGIVSSGYGRDSSTSMVAPGSEIAGMPAREIGDEVKLLASQFPGILFSIATSKRQAAKEMSGTGSVDLVLVDDGFQHYGLYRDLDIVLWDATVLERSIRLLPHGILREPTSALGRAGVVILTRVDQGESIEQARILVKSNAPDAHIFEARFIHTELIGRSTRYPMTFLNKRRVLVFAGIGNFGAFRRQIEAEGAVVVSACEFDDHQQYGPDHLQQIADRASRDKVDLIVTTGKDFVKLGDFDFGRECCYLGLDVALSPSGDKLVDLVLQFANRKDVHR